jgi:magnesium and cobalt transporter
MVLAAYETVAELDLGIVAKIDIEEVGEHFNCSLPEGPYESAGGLLIHRLGRVPKNGDTVVVEPLTFKVMSASPRRVKTVRIRVER